MDDNDARIEFDAPAFESCSAAKGDFKTTVAQQVAPHIGSDPVVLVVKKHKRILENVIEWTTREKVSAYGREVVLDHPILVIDQRFSAMGCECRVIVEGPHEGDAARRVQDTIAAVDARLSRFRPDSELSQLNADPRPAVPATPLVCAAVSYYIVERPILRFKR